MAYEQAHSTRRQAVGKRHPAPCRCSGYAFPHRAGSRNCVWSDPREIRLDRLSNDDSGYDRDVQDRLDRETAR